MTLLCKPHPKAESVPLPLFKKGDLCTYVLSQEDTFLLSPLKELKTSIHILCALING